MLRLGAFKLEKSASGSTSLQAGETATLNPITEFGANADTEEEEKEKEKEKSLLDIIEAFNGRHGTTFSREDFLRFERVNQEIMDEDMKDKMRNNPADVVSDTFSKSLPAGHDPHVSDRPRYAEHRHERLWWLRNRQPDTFSSGLREWYYKRHCPINSTMFSSPAT